MLNSREILIYLSLQNDGDYNRIAAAMKLKTLKHDPRTDALFKKLRCKTVTILDPDYPPAVSTAVKNPFVLFYEGNLGLLSDPDRCITIVGSRDASDYVLEETKRLSSELASDGYVIVSGLARGVDAAAHEGAIKYGKTVAFLGNGLDYAFPSDNRDLQERLKRDGLVITEYPPHVPPSSRQFPARNRMLAACSDATLCTSAQPRSGTLVTISFALYYGHEVGCLPDRSTSHNYCNQLIKEGAWLIETKEDVIDMLRHPLSSKK